MVSVAETIVVCSVCSAESMPSSFYSRYTQIDGITLEILVLLRSEFGRTCRYT